MSPLDSDRPHLGSYRPSTDVGEGANEDFLFHLYRGSELLGDNRVLEAKEELEAALRLSPRDAKGQDLLAVVYFRLGLYPRAIAIFDGLLRVNPRDPALKLNLALCYLKTGQIALARQELEDLTELNPNHTRAWGYLGLAYERLGEYQKAESAFALGNHPQMARRMADRIAQSDHPSAPGPRAPTQPIPAEDAPLPPASALAPPSASREEDVAGEPDGAEPDSRGPESDATIIVHEVARASLGHDLDVDEAPAKRVAVTAELPPDGGADAKPTVVPHNLGVVTEERTMPSAQSPFAGMRVPPRDGAAPPPRPAVTARPAAPEAPPFGAPYDITVVHDQLALVRLDGQPDRGFAARLAAIRSMTTSLSTSVLEKRTRARTSEAFGGASNPMVDIRGEGELVLGARHGQTLVRFAVGPDPWFLREDTLVALDLALVFENGRLTTSEGEHVGLVRVRGTGAVLVEFPRASLALDVRGGHGVSARKEAVLGWTGRIVPRALPPGEAPCGQRGMLAFAGEGQVFLLT